jgi:indole-3-glycerol phosphate synthase
LNILQEIEIRTRERIEAQKKLLSHERIVEMSRAHELHGFPFEKALKSETISFICEIKKASPSKGIIAEDFPYLDLAKEYQAAGAAAISVLTEPYFFKGDDRYLREIADQVSIPILRKDFVIDSYMIYQARVLGAKAVLLICAMLNRDTLAEYIAIAHSLGLSALVETHSEEEVEMGLACGAKIIGVNNRDLKTFEIDMTLSGRLKQMVPEDKLFVSESGITSPEDVVRLRKLGADAVLIGEAIMRSSDKRSEILRLRGDDGKG